MYQKRLIGFVDHYCDIYSITWIHLSFDILKKAQGDICVFEIES